jgi:hypothetical protein
MANTSLYDLAVLHRADPYTGLIEDVTTLAPEFSTFSAVSRDGTWYEVASRTTLPTAQFRSVNSGVATSKSTYKKAIKEMFNLDVQLQQDEAVWKADTGEIGKLWQMEAAGAMRSASILLGQQAWYGTSADSKGFVGVRDQLSYQIKAAGTSNSTSAYLVWMDPKEGARFDVGQGGQFAISAPRLQQVVDGSSNPYMAYVGNLQAWVGLNVGSAYSCWAVTGLTTTLAQWLTDDLVAQLIGKIPAARRNNLRLFINRTGESTLQRSRATVINGLGNPTAVSAGGTGGVALQPSDAAGRPAFAPLPLSTNGYPITLTDSILDTETNS